MIILCGFCLPVGNAGSEEAGDRVLHPRLADYVAARLNELEQIPDERVELLEKLAAYVKSAKASGRPARLTFICTHNSRRSQMAQLWATAAAVHFGVDNVETYSGGTESTAFNPRAVAALQRAGFRIVRPTEEKNPEYEVSVADVIAPQRCFSKVYDDLPNPPEGFCAVMTCAAADESCPQVAGASLRLAIPYEDPKAADNTSAESATYDERSAQIAREMLFAFSKVHAEQAGLAAELRDGREDKEEHDRDEHRRRSE